MDARYLDPRRSWGDDDAYDKAAQLLARLFQNNVQKYDVPTAIIAAGPTPRD